MDDRPGVVWRGGMLRRPAVDPSIPGPDRAMLTAPGTFLTPASSAPPPVVRDYLPGDPDRRGTTVDGAVMGFTAAGFIAAAGATPYAIGVLIFQGPAGWQAASGRYALIIAEIVAIVTAVVLGGRIARSGQLSGKDPASVTARRYHGRYLTGADFDDHSRTVLRRAQDAIDAVTSAAVYRSGLLDEHAVRMALAEQEWDIAVALREHGQLRVRRSAFDDAGPATAAVLDWQAEAARLADASIAERVAALERYADEVRAADAAYRDWRQSEAASADNDRHLDILARTAAGEHGIAGIEAMSQQARAVRLALRELRER